MSPKLTSPARALTSLGAVMAASVSLSLCLQVTQQVPVGKHPRSIVTADVNNDGALDLITTNREDDNLSILTGNNQGTFTLSGSVAVGGKPVSSAAADFDRDGDVDLAVANSKSNTVSIHYGNGSGGFTAGAVIAVKKDPSWVGAADLNDDGWPDLVALCAVDNKMAILMGNGTGSFAAPVYKATQNRPAAGALADLDGDGAMDAAVVHSTSNSVSIHFGDGTGGIDQVVTYGAGLDPEDVSVVDLDQDGLLDLAIAALADHAIVVLWGTGPRTFSPPTSQSHFFAASGDPQSLVTLDMDGDCVADAVAASPATGEVLFMPSNGNGGFGAPHVVLTGNEPQRLIAADFNGDLSPDLAITDRAANKVIIVTNETLACGAFVLRRGTDPATVAASEPYRVIGQSPFDDDEGTLSDGTFYYYTLEHSNGLPVSLSAHPNKVLDAVRLGFNDGNPLNASVDHDRSTVTAAPEELPGGVMAARVTVFPRDANGTGIGTGCEIVIDAGALYPGMIDGTVTDLGNGAYTFRVVPSAPGSALIVVTVEGTMLDDQPMVGF